MEGRKRRLLAWALALSLILGLAPTAWATASNARADYSGLDYTINGESVTITGLAAGNTETKISIPDTIDGKPVTAINGAAFADTALTGIEIPNSVTSIGGGAFSSCASLSSVTFGTDSELGSIGERVFYRCEALTGITIPDSVTSIGKNAFDGCKRLSTVTFGSGSGLSSIGHSAFADTALTGINIPTSVTSIGDYAFKGTALTGIKIPDSVTSIGVDAFNGCASLSTVTFGSGSELSSIGAGAFLNCALTGIEIPDKVTSIADGVFKDCDKLATVNFGSNDKLETIGQRAFEGTALTGIEIPSNITSIGTGVFHNCDKLATVNFGSNDKLETIGQRAFEGTALTGINIPTSVTSIGDCAFKGTALTGIEIPDKVTQIGMEAFKDCKQLTTVGFGSDSELETIGQSAFVGTALTEIEIPSKVTWIGGGALNITSLKFVTMKPATAPTLYGTDVFGLNVTIFIPANGQNYETATYWSGMTNKLITDPKKLTVKNNNPAGMTVTPSAKNNKLVEYQQGEYRVAAAETVTLTITPVYGKMFDGAPGVSVTGASQGNVTQQPGGSYTCAISNFTGDTEVTVSGTVKDITYLATLKQDGLSNAAASLTQYSGIGSGNSVTLTVTPNTGYEFKADPSVSVTGADQGTLIKQANGSYICTISNFTNNATVTVSGAATGISYNISYENMDDATHGANYPTKHTYGETTTLVNPTRTGYTFGGWYTKGNFEDSSKVERLAADGYTDKITLYAKWLSSDASITSVSLNTKVGEINENDKTVAITLDYGSSLPTDGGAFTIEKAPGATAATPTKTAADGSEWSVTVTAEDKVSQQIYTIRVSIASDPASANKADVAAAKSAVENKTWTVGQSRASTEDTLKAWIGEELSKMNLNGAQAEVTHITVTPAKAGNAEDRDGTNGSFAFTVKLSKGDRTRDTGSGTYAEVTAEVSNGTITATPYTGGGSTTGGSTHTQPQTPGQQIEAAQPGDTVEIKLPNNGKVDKEVFEALSGKDVTVEITISGGLSWTINGTDIPKGMNFSDLNLSVKLDTNGISAEVINKVTGAKGTIQLTLSHNGPFGFAMTLNAPLGKENAGYWANLYHFNEQTQKLDYETSGRIGADGSAALRMTHASQYAIVIDDKSHAPADFSDVSKADWFYDAVQYAYQNGLMNGTGNGLFSPKGTTNRAMIATILWRQAGSPVVDYLMDFSDVASGQWYTEAVRWAASEGIVSGYGNGKFGVNDAITREQLATMLYRYAQKQSEDVSAAADLSGYTDASQVSDWALDALRWANAEGIINGNGNGCLNPGGNATKYRIVML